MGVYGCVCGRGGGRGRGRKEWGCVCYVIYTHYDDEDNNNTPTPIAMANTITHLSTYTSIHANNPLVEWRDGVEGALRKAMEEEGYVFMYIHICVCTRVYVCMCVYMYVCMCIYISSSLHPPARVTTHASKATPSPPF